MFEEIKFDFFKLKRYFLILFFFNSFGVKDYYPVYSFRSPYYNLKCMFANNDAFGILNNDETAWDYRPDAKPSEALPFVEIDESTMSFSKCFPFLNNPTQEDFFILTLMFFLDLVDDESRIEISLQLFFDFSRKSTKDEQLDFLIKNLLNLKKKALGLKFINDQFISHMMEVLDFHKKSYESVEKEVAAFLKAQRPWISYSVKKNFGDIDASFKWVYLDLFLDSRYRSSEFSMFYNLAFYYIHSMIKKQLESIVNHFLPKIRYLRNSKLEAKKKENSSGEDEPNSSAFSSQEPVHSLNPHRAEKKLYTQSAAAADDESSESESLEEKSSRYSAFKHRSDDVVDLIKAFESSPDKELILSCMGNHSSAFLSLIEIFKVFKIDEDGKKVDSKTVSIKPDDIYAKISLLEQENEKGAGTGRKFSLKYKEGSFPLVFHKTHSKSSKNGYESGEFKSIKQFLGNVLSHISQEGCFL